jgi:acetoacetyl-CoA reductase
MASVSRNSWLSRPICVFFNRILTALHIGTDMVRAVRPEILDAIVQSIPMRRLGEVTEIASIVSWLASDEAAFATGADFSPNGGLYMS